jgi:hypothetical protein
MPEFFYCPFFDVHVEVTDERYEHVAAHHFDFASRQWDKASETLFQPDEIWSSRQLSDAVVFFRWYDDIGNYVQVVVRGDPGGRRWLATAHIAGRIRGSELIWKRN